MVSSGDEEAGPSGAHAEEPGQAAASSRKARGTKRTRHVLQDEDEDEDVADADAEQPEGSGSQLPAADPVGLKGDSEGPHAPAQHIAKHEARQVLEDSNEDDLPAAHYRPDAASRSAQPLPSRHARVGQPRCVPHHTCDSERGGAAACREFYRIGEYAILDRHAFFIAAHSHHPCSRSQRVEIYCHIWCVGTFHQN